jgi:hypothetical protein
MNPCSPQGGRRLAAPSLIVTAVATAAALLPAGTSAATAHAASAGAYHRADAAVVAAAKRVVACERAAGAKSATRCATRRENLQRAGVKLSRLQHTTTTARASKASTVSGRQKAPTLTVSGTTLKWGKVADVTTYVLVSKLAGRDDRYSVVRGTQTTPAATAGKTVAFAVRTAIVGSKWSGDAKIAYPAATSSTPTTTTPSSSSDPRKAAPKLVVENGTVRWAKVADVDTYAYVVKIPGVTDVYKTVTGLSITPAPVPGKTVKVGVRTNVEGSTWASEATLTFSTTTTTTTTTTTGPAGGGASSGGGSGSGTTTTAPSTSATFQAGIVSGSAINWELPFVKTLGAKAARMEFDISTPAADLASAVDNYAKAGIQPLLLAGFHGRTPTAAEARNLASWAAAYGPGGTFWAGKNYAARTAVTHIEFGNESNQSWQYPALASDPNWPASATYKNIATQYALGFKEAATSIKAANGGVSLLAIGDTPGNWASWMDTVFATVPDFSSYVGGWVMHPYGPTARWQPNMDNALSMVASHGAPSTIPIFITEYGIASDNGRCLDDNYGWDKCMSYDQAGSALSSTVTAMRARYGSRLAGMYLYQAHDLKSSTASSSREMYFGGLTLDGTAKGGYTTAVKSLLAG